MIKVYFYCEGVTDYEPLCSIMKRFQPDFEIIRKTRTKLKNGTMVLQGRRGIHAHTTFIKRLAMVAMKDDCNNIAYHRDGDGDYENVYNAVMKDFADNAATFNCLAVIPKEMIESWLLADENAYELAFGKKPTNSTLHRKPEELWGSKENENSNYPKHIIAKVLQQYHAEGNRETFFQIAENVDVNVLKTKCPTSFGRFAKDIEIFIAKGTSLASEGA
jgi:hypothetical protein